MGTGTILIAPHLLAFFFPSFLSLSHTHTYKHIHVFSVARFSSPFQCILVSWHLFHPRLPQGTDLGLEGGHRRRKRTVENHPDLALSLLYSRAFLLPVVIRFIVNPVWRWGGNTGPRESPRWCLWNWKWHLLFVHLGILPSFFFNAHLNISPSLLFFKLLCYAQETKSLMHACASFSLVPALPQSHSILFVFYLFFFFLCTLLSLPVGSRA